MSYAQKGKRCVRGLTFKAQGIFPVKMDVTDASRKTLLSKTRDVRVRDLLIVVLGDSMSSGEGSPDLGITAGKKARWVDPQPRTAPSSTRPARASRAPSPSSIPSRTAVTKPSAGPTSTSWCRSRQDLHRAAPKVAGGLATRP